MAQDAGKIHVAPGRIFMGTTAPASGAPPTWLTHTNGVPADGTEVGFTLGDAVFTWNTEKADIEGEQALGVVDQFITKENAQLEFEAQERNYLLMKAAFDNIGSVDDGTRMGFYGGGGGTILNIQYTTVVVTSQIRNLTNKYEVLMMYKAVSMVGMPLTYSRTKPSTYKVTLRGLPLSTRTAGDQIFQFSREK
jgi:hypothetical protein